MIKVLLVFGTRPEAIKMAPVYHSMIRQKQFLDVKVCVTGQHRQMLDMVIKFFNIQIDYDLNIMRENQNLYTISTDILDGMYDIFQKEKFDWILVHGDTTTSTMAALAAFYSNIKVAHVEAGLRTFNKYAPFPEEVNRTLTSKLADIHFAPTQQSFDNLKNEGILPDSILVTGNTVIDALFLGLNRINESNHSIKILKQKLLPNKKIILITAHRRENFGVGFENLCTAIRNIAEQYTNEIQIVYPVHLNPNVREPVSRLLSGIRNVLLIEPLEYEAFIWLMNKSYFILTDSGGVQEEAPSLGKPVLVMRDTTERPEAVSAGTVILVGTDSEKIYNTSAKIIDSNDFYNELSSKHNPYGDGLAAERITKYFTNQFF